MRSWLYVAALSGCQVVFPLKEPPKDAPVDSPPDEPEIDAKVCITPGTTCFTGGTASSMVDCSLAPVTNCDSRLFRFCECGEGLGSGGLLVLPNPGDPVNKTDIFYTSLAGLGNVSMARSFNSSGELCAGVHQMICDIDEVACGAGNNTVRKWTVNTGAGQYKIKVFDDTTNPGPCNAADIKLNVTADRQ